MTTTDSGTGVTADLDLELGFTLGLGRPFDGAVGMGRIDFATVFEGLADAGWSGTATLEVGTEDLTPSRSASATSRHYWPGADRERVAPGPTPGRPARVPSGA